jgi:tRNA modification GTPase
MNTIYALSSGALPSGVAVIRVSGPRARDILTALVGPLPQARVGDLRLIRNPKDGALIDAGLALWFPGPASFTGEDTAELQVHGGKAVVAAILDAVGRGGARLARPGEFARRSFQNGKLDLTQVEGLADLIAAETEAQQRQAIAAVRGELSRRAEDWRGRLIDLRAQLEARLDFSGRVGVGSKQRGRRRKG